MKPKASYLSCFLPTLDILCDPYLSLYRSPTSPPSLYPPTTQPILCQPLSLTIPTPDVPIDGVPETPDINVINVNNYLNCSSIVGYLAVYRINMAIASFFFLLTLIMLCVFSSKDPRSYVQNG